MANRNLSETERFPNMSDELIYNKTEHGELLTPKEASAHLKAEHRINRSVARLADLRCVGGGPLFMKQAARVFYPLALLDDWARELNASPLLKSTPFAVETAA